MHQILATIDSVQTALSMAADANPVYLSTEEKKAALVALMRTEGRLAELRLRIEAAAADLAEHECARDVGAVLVAAGLDDARHAHGEVRLAQALERYGHVRDGLAAGCFTLADAQVIVTALDALAHDGDVGGDLIAKAELHLCDLARQHTPRELRVLGKHILTVVAPEAGEAAEAGALAREEADAASKACLSITPQGDGTTRLYGIVPDAVGVRLRTLLESFAQPRVAALEADGKTRSRSRLMAEALESLLECVDSDHLPRHGGDATTVVVTIPLEQLRREVGTAQMPDGTLLTAAETRRIACSAAIIPAVLGGKSEILDLGRARRLFTPTQRKALRIRDKHCQAEGCTVPATWCDARHADAWAHGGKTDLADGVLLCGHHHRRAHDPRFETSRLPNGDFRYHRRR